MKKARQDGKSKWWLLTLFWMGCLILLYGGYQLYNRSIEQAVHATTISFMEQLADHDQLNVTNQMKNKWEYLNSIAERANITRNKTIEDVLYDLGVEAKANAFEELYLITDDGRVLSNVYVETVLSEMPWGEAYLSGEENFVIRYSESSRERWGEYLVYGINLRSPISCGSENIMGLVGLVPIAEISSQMRMESFDGRGIAIVMNPAGEIITASQNYSSSTDTQNFLNEIEKATFKDGSSAKKCRKSIAEGKKLFVRYEQDGESFYTLFQPLNAQVSTGWYLVVRVSEQVTAEQVRTLIIRSVPFFIILGMLILAIMYIVYHSMNQVRVARASEQAKSSFLANMSHEIRTPLNGIMGLHYLIRQNLGNPDKVEEYLRKAEVSAEFLKSVITDVLDMSKIESGQMEIYNNDMNLSDVVSELQLVFETQTDEKGLCFQVDCQNLIYPHVQGDAIRIKQILMNLLGNALKFTPKGGKVTLAVSQREERGTAYTTFIVSDTGSGMSPEFLKKIWMPFEQEKRVASQNGTGLGTTLSKTLAEKMGGSIAVASQIGEGTTFTVVLPLQIIQQPAMVQMEVEESALDWEFKGKHVLVAEDNDINRMIAVSVMENAGCIVTEAVDGQEAVEAFQNSPPHYFDLIFMDIQMPKLDGYEATRRIRSLDRPDSKKVVILALTANAFREDVDRAFESGMNDLVTKPLDVPMLLNKIISLKSREEI